MPHFKSGKKKQFTKPSLTHVPTLPTPITDFFPVKPQAPRAISTGQNKGTCPEVLCELGGLRWRSLSSSLMRPRSEAFAKHSCWYICRLRGGLQDTDKSSFCELHFTKVALADRDEEQRAWRAPSPGQVATSGLSCTRAPCISNMFSPASGQTWPGSCRVVPGGNSLAQIPATT